jgi:nucleoid-associated protein YgaU
MVRIEDVVGLAAVVLGAALAAWFFLGLSVAAACAAARSAGRGWAAGERLVARAAPEVVRRALVVSAGTGVALAGAALPAMALAPPEDLGWSVTSDVAPTTPVPVPAAPVPSPAPAPSSEPVPAPAPVPPPGPLPATAVSAPVGAVADPAAGSAPGTAPAAAVTDAAAPGPTVVVAAGDTLWAIASEHLPAPVRLADVAAAWPAWYAANVDVIGSDPDLIRPGQRLEAPAGVAADGADR